MPVRYLTTQDLLWINLQVTRKVLEFQWTELEEAANAQYALGPSGDVVAQAERFLKAMVRKAPFQYGNEATALIGVAAFLRINDLQLNVADADAQDWLGRVLGGSEPFAGRVATEFHDEIEHVDERAVHDVIVHTLRRFPASSAELGKPPFSPEPVAAGFAGQEIWTGPGDVRDYLG